jgi:hypothetical protein
VAVALTVLLWLLAALACAVVLLVALPVRITVRAGSVPPSLALRLRLLGGLIPEFTLSGGSSAPGTPPASHATHRKRRPGPPRWTPPVGKMIRAAPTLLAGLVRPFRIEYLRIDMHFGLGDPAATGELFGLLAPLAYGTAGSDRLRISLRPEFEKRCLTGEAEGAVRFVPVALIPPALRFAWAVFVR